MEYFFYCLDGDDEFTSRRTLNEEYLFRLWHPTYSEIVPQGVSLIPFGVWWVFHHFHVFKNQHYSLVLIYREDKLIHRSGIFPGYFRFPFMTKDDLQIGDTWTAPDHRGLGLATYAIQEIVNRYRKPGRRFWYIVESENIPSIRVVEKAGFCKMGEGVRMPRLGVSMLGCYMITKSLMEGDADEQ